MTSHLSDRGPPPSILAREFRGSSNERQRIAIARKYAQAVRQLIDGKKWRRIPPVEDQLPDEWMPQAFFQHWSLTPPPTRIGKPTILLEGPEDVAILKALLSSDLSEECELQSIAGPHSLAAAARTYIRKHPAPVAILFDTDSLDETVIAEQVQAMKESVHSAARAIPVEIIRCIPKIEAIFFNGAVNLGRIFPKFEGAIVPELAETDPKRQLDVLFENGGGPKNLHGFLALLGSNEVKKLQAKDPIRRIIAFIKKNAV